MFRTYDDWKCTEPEETAMTENCIYCHNDVSELNAPDPDDNEAWAEISAHHMPWCEWVVTRAHSIADSREDI